MLSASGSSWLCFSSYKTMNTVLDIGKLSHTDKLRAMEELWDDLSRSQDEYLL